MYGETFVKLNSFFFLKLNEKMAKKVNILNFLVQFSLVSPKKHILNVHIFYFTKNKKITLKVGVLRNLTDCNVYRHLIGIKMKLLSRLFL